MSLSNFITIKTNKSRFNTSFPRPKLKISGTLRFEPLSKSYATVGIAIDYLIRFQLKYIFPKSKSNIWIAEKTNIESENEFDKYLNKAKKYYEKFLKDGKISKGLINSTIDLAKIDTFYRTGGYYYPDTLGNYETDVVKDIYNIIKNIDFKKFNIKKRCILNPNFGAISENIGGADADLIIDNKIIDIKTTKKLEITREMLNQMIGYYFLGKFGKVKGVKDWSTIDEIGFYFSRYDLLYLFPIDILILPKKRVSFEKWFINKIVKYSEQIEKFQFYKQTGLLDSPIFSELVKKEIFK